MRGRAKEGRERQSRRARELESLRKSRVQVNGYSDGINRTEYCHLEGSALFRLAV